MADSMLAVLLLAILVSAGLRVSMRVVMLADVQSALEQLPARIRRRVHWWQVNARYVQLACVLAAAASICTQLGSTIG
jgi:hypothetical protein